MMEYLHMCNQSSSQTTDLSAALDCYGISCFAEVVVLVVLLSLLPAV